MKAIIETISPAGYKVAFEVEAEQGLEAVLSRLADVELVLSEAGYAPTGELPRTPDGLPICRKHGMVMKLRQRQGDEWFSHAVVMGDGRELWCKGRAGADSPGWEV